MGIVERKEREKEHRKEEILDAAQKVFFERGLSIATMDEIADAAELSKGTLYLYYSSKEDLYLAVMMRGMQALHETYEQIINSNASVVEKIIRCSDSYVEFFHSNRKFFRMFPFLQNPQFHKQVSEAMKEWCGAENQKLWKMVIDLLKQGMEEGMLRADLNPVEIGIIIWSSSTALLVRGDSEGQTWKAKLNIDFDHTLEVSNTLLMESILTERGRKEFHALKKIK
jgi:TetR/AcrR family transcriptional regulator